MKLSLNKIMEFNPCGQHTKGESGISKLTKYLNKSDFNDIEEFELITVLKSNGINDAVWCLRCFDYLDYCLFLADIIESVLPIYEAEYSSKATRKLIQAIRDFKAGKITKDELNDFTSDAYVAAYAASAYSASAGDTAAIYAAAYAAVYATANANANADADAAADSKWLEIEQLFIKHFG